MLELSIARRFLRRSPAQSTLIIAGIAVGIAVQIFVGSLISSLQDDLIDTTVGSSPHVTLLPEGGGVLDGSLAERAQQHPDVTAAIPVRRLSVIYRNGDTSVPLSVTSATADDLDAIYGLSERVTDGQYELGADGIIVGAGFAQDSAVARGDDVTVLLPDGRNAEYTVAGVFDLGAAAANDRFAFLNPASGADALGQADDAYSAIEVQVADVFASTDVATDLARLGDLSAVDWQAENAELLSGLAAQSGSSAMIQLFVLIAVALGIASTLAVSAVQKTRQIGILKAMGLRDAASGRIFLWQAVLLGATGVLGGIAVGYLLIWAFSFAPVTFSVRPEPAFIALSAAVGITVALLSSIIPARSTSRVDPIEVIQGG